MVVDVAALSDECVVSCGYDRQIVVWNVRTLERLYTFRERDSSVRPLAINQEGSLVTGDSRSVVKVWDMNRKEVKLIHDVQSRDMITSVARLFENKYIIFGSYDKSIRVWGSSSGEVIQTVKVDTMVFSLCPLRKGTNYD